MRILNQTVVSIELDHTKKHLYIHRLNFLGYHVKPKEHRVSLRSVKFLNDYKNPYITLDFKGLIPSFSRLITFGPRKNAIKLGFNFKLDESKKVELDLEEVLKEISSNKKL